MAILPIRLLIFLMVVSKNRDYFVGDFTDRGNFSVEVALTIFCYKLVRPDAFFVLRGNHESPVRSPVHVLSRSTACLVSTEKSATSTTEK